MGQHSILRPQTMHGERVFDHDEMNVSVAQERVLRTARVFEGAGGLSRRDIFQLDLFNLSAGPDVGSPSGVSNGER